MKIALKMENKCNLTGNYLSMCATTSLGFSAFATISKCMDFAQSTSTKTLNILKLRRTDRHT